MAELRLAELRLALGGFGSAHFRLVLGWVRFFSHRSANLGLT